MEKLVSVFINAYNSEKFILETVNSVLNQTYKNIQLIVIDDCSTDNTYELLKTVNDERLEIYKNNINMGISYTCNRGIATCRGEYIAHTDSDDVWVADKIEKQLQFLQENPEYDACFSHAYIIDSNGNFCNDSELKTIYAMHNLPQAEMFRYFIENPNRLCHSAVLAKASIVKKIGWHKLSTRYLHDFDYWLRMITLCNIYIIQEPLVLVRTHEGSNSSMNEKKWIAHDNELLYILDSAIENCPDELFLRAFEDKLHIKGEHSHEEVELEKAFYSIYNIYRFKDNPILGINRFTRLFDRDKKYIKLAIDKFDFKLKDLYDLQTNRLYSDINLINNQKNTIDNQKSVIDNQKDIIDRQKNVIDNQESTIDDQKGVIDDLLNAKQSQDEDFKRLKKVLSDKDSEIKTLGDLVLTEQNNSMILQNNINSLQAELSNLNSSYNQMLNSFSWKITAPLRKIIKFFKNH